MHDVRVAVPDGEVNVWRRPAAPGRPTALLIHGLTGTSRWWLPVLSHLPSDLGLIAVDARGRGQSWRAPGPYDLATLGDDLATVLAHFEVPEAVVAGYSMGAWVAALAGVRHPDRVSRLVLIDGGLAGERDISLDAEQALRRAVGPSLARLDLEFDDHQAYFEWWRQHPALAGQWRPELEPVFCYDLHQAGGRWRVRAEREAVVEAGRGITVDAGVGNAAREVVHAATLLVVDHGMLGGPGGFIPLDAAREAARANPNIDVRLLDGLNHYTLMLGDGAAEVAAAISG